MEHGSRSVLGRAGDNLVSEQSTGGNQGGQHKSIDEETSSHVVMCVPSGRPVQQMAGVPRCTMLVGNYYIAFSIHYGGKWGPLSLLF